MVVFNKITKAVDKLKVTRALPSIINCNAIITKSQDFAK